MAAKGKKTKGLKNKKKKAKMFNQNAFAKFWESKLRKAEESRSSLMRQNLDLEKENEILKQSEKASGEDMMGIVGYFKEEDAQKTFRIKQLEEQLANTTVSFEERIDRIKEDAEREVEKLRKEAQETDAEFEQVKKELNSLNEFYSMREKIVLEMESIKDSTEMALQEHREEVKSMEREHQRELSKIKEYMIREIESSKLNSLDEAFTGIQKAEMKVFEENIKLSDLAVRNSGTIAKLRTRIENQHKAILSLSNQHKLNEDVKRLTISKMKDTDRCHKLKARLEELEDTVRALKEEKGSLRGEIGREWSQKCSDHVQENRKLKLILAEMLKENRELKRLSSEVVRERSEVERFIHEGLEYTRRQRAPRNCKVPRMGRLPPIGESLGESSDRRLENCSWEQKEEILRYLFAGMNMGRDH